MIFEMPYFKQQIADEHGFIKVPGIYRHFQRSCIKKVHVFRKANDSLWVISNIPADIAANLHMVAVGVMYTNLKRCDLVEEPTHDVAN